MTATGSKSTLAVIGALVMGMVLLSGCAPEPDVSDNTSQVEEAGAGDAAETADAETSEEANTSDDAGPAEQADSCEWDIPKRGDAPASGPSGQDGDLTTVMIGSWQHTHSDTGGGFEPTENDHRYVFPTSDQLLYCQHVEGITDYAENRAPVTISGTVIHPPEPHPGFEVVSWSQNQMVWTNNFDGSTYLLHRR